MNDGGIFYPALTLQISGNTSGTTALVSSGTGILAGGANITLSQVGNAISIVGGAGGGGSQLTAYATSNTTQSSTGTIALSSIIFAGAGIASVGVSNGSVVVSVPAGAPSPVNFSAGATSDNLGSVVFSNSNGVSFGLNGSTITATVKTDYLTTAMASNRGSDFVQATAAFAGTSASGTIASGGISVSIGPYITTGMLSNAATISNINISGGTTSSHLSRFELVNSNGVSWSLDTASKVYATVKTDYLTTAMASNRGSDFVAATAAFAGTSASGTIASNGISVSIGPYITTGMLSNAVTISNINVSGGTTSSNLSAIKFIDSNGVSWSLDTGSKVYATVKTDYLTSQSNQNVTAGNGGFAFQTLSFSNVNGISFGTSAGSAITGSHNGLTTQTNQQMSLFATGNTTLSSSGTSNASSLIFRGTNAVSIGITNGSIVFDAPNAAAGNVTFSASANSSGLASVIFANSNNITFGLTTGSQITASFGGGGGVGAGVSTGGNTAGSTGTVTTGNVVFVGTGAITLSQSTGAAGSNATISFSVPQTSSLVGTHGLSVSTNGSTISVYPNIVSQWDVDLDQGYATNSSLGQNTLYFQPFDLAWPVSGSRLNVFIRLSGATSTGTASTCGAVLAMGYGLYTRGTGASSERLSLLTSYSMNVMSHTVTNGSSYGATFYNQLSNATSHSTSTFSAQSSSGWTTFTNSLYGQRVIAFPLNSTLTPGRYWLALINSTTTANLNNLNFSVSVFHTSIAGVADVRPFGVSSAASNASVFRAVQGWGSYSTTTGAFPASVALSTDNIRAAAAQTLNQFNISGLSQSSNIL